MKKIFSIILLTILLIPVTVKADMGAPEVLNYTAIVIRDTGVDFYSEVGKEPKKAGHLDKDEKVEVQYELTDDGVTYLFACQEDAECFYVDSSYVLPENKEVSPDHKGVYKYSEPVEFFINADEVEVRKGPSISYESVGKLVKGYKGKTSYIASSHYIYVETDKIKGWVEMLGEAVFKKSSRNLIAVTDVLTKCGVIPANTIIDDVWDATAWDGTSKIKYNGCEDIVRTFRSSEFYYISQPIEETAYEDGKIYETGELKKELVSIPKDSKMQVMGRSGNGGQTDVLYVEYNGVKGYYASNSYVELMNEQNANPQKPEPVEPTPEPIEPTPEPAEDIEPIEPKEDTKESKGMDTLTIVIICCVSAIAIALAAVTTIVLINKKKKKNAPVQTPESTSEPVTPVENEQVENTLKETTTEEKIEEEKIEEDKKEEL